jgi:hypothetical protein
MAVKSRRADGKKGTKEKLKMSLCFLKPGKRKFYKKCAETKAHFL